MTPRKLPCDFQAGSHSPRASAASAPVPSSPSLHVHRHLLSAPDGTRAGFAVSDAGPTAPPRKPSQERLPSPRARGPRSSRPPSPHLSHVLGVTSFRKTRPACCQQRAAELAPVEMITETRDCDSAGARRRGAVPWCRPVSTPCPAPSFLCHPWCWFHFRQVLAPVPDTRRATPRGRRELLLPPVPSRRCEETFPGGAPSVPARLQNPLDISLTKTSSRVTPRPTAGAGSGTTGFTYGPPLAPGGGVSPPQARDCARGERGDLVTTQMPSGRKQKKQVTRARSLRLVPCSSDSCLAPSGLPSQNAVDCVA